jgi:hypothetical protein
MPELPRIIVAAFTTCCDCTDEIWPGEPAYPTGHGTRCLICQAQITPWVPDEPAGRGGGEADELVGVAGTFIRVVAVQLGLTDMIGGDA